MTSEKKDEKLEEMFQMILTRNFDAEKFKKLDEERNSQCGLWRMYRDALARVGIDINSWKQPGFDPKLVLSKDQFDQLRTEIRNYKITEEDKEYFEISRRTFERITGCGRGPSTSTRNDNIGEMGNQNQ